MDSMRVQLRMPPDVLADLDRLAEQYGVSRSAMVRILVRQAAMGGALRPPPIEINDQRSHIVSPDPD